MRPYGSTLILGTLLTVQTCLAQNITSPSTNLLVGWAQTDITPTRAACLGGMTCVRVSTNVMDPLTATALALEAPYQGTNSEPVILVSCDLRGISTQLLAEVRAALRTSLPEIDATRVILNATHTHNAPPLSTFGLPLTAMDEPEYVAFAVPRIAAAAEKAWRSRQPGGISFGLAQAVIGHNRIMVSDTGKSKMGVRVQRPEFSHIEGYEDPAVQLLYTWDRAGKLTGVIVNVAVTAQVSQDLSVISADYWHDTREELRRRLGAGLFVLPQCSAAGDQMSRSHVHARAEQRMERLTGRTHRQQIAVSLADAVTSILPAVRTEIDWAPVLAHRSAVVPLARRLLSEEDLKVSRADAAEARQIYEQALLEFKTQPTLLDDVQWRDRVTRAHRRVKIGETVESRFAAQKSGTGYPAELHVIRLGDVALATNPFELYLDFGIQIKGRVKPVQTFLVELASGTSGYLPTARSVAGGAYGANPITNTVGPEGGKELVTWTVAAINALWPDKAAAPTAPRPMAPRAE